MATRELTVKELITGMNKARLGPVVPEAEDFFPNDILYFGGCYYLVVSRSARGPDFPINREALSYCTQHYAKKNVEAVVVLVEGEDVLNFRNLGKVNAVVAGVSPIIGEYGPYNWFDLDFNLVQRPSRTRGPFKMRK